MQSQDAGTELKLVEYTDEEGLVVGCVDNSYEVWRIGRDSPCLTLSCIRSFYSFIDTNKVWIFKGCLWADPFIDPLLRTQGTVDFLTVEDRLLHVPKFMLTILGLDVRWDQLLSIYKEVCLNFTIQSLSWVQARTYISDQFTIPAVGDAKVPEWFKRNHLYKTMKEHWQK